MVYLVPYNNYIIIVMLFTYKYSYYSYINTCNIIIYKIIYFLLVGI